MKKWEILLDILIEECAEVIQRVTKAKRFGLTEVQEGQNLSNALRIMLEFSDLYAVYGMLVEEGFLPYLDNCAVHAKIQKVEKYLELSRKEGRLED